MSTGNGPDRTAGYAAGPDRLGGGFAEPRSRGRAAGAEQARQQDGRGQNRGAERAKGAAA